MIVLPAGAVPEGFVRVTTCPARECLPVTVNPRLSSTCVALAKRRPTTSGIATAGEVLGVGARTVGVAVGAPVGDAGRELAGDAVRGLAAESAGELAGSAEAEPGGGTAAAALERDADVAGAVTAG